MPTIFRPVPDLHERVWGGHRLGSPRGQPIGEAWVAGPSNVIADGPDEGRTLAEVVHLVRRCCSSGVQEAFPNAHVRD